MYDCEPESICLATSIATVERPQINQDTVKDDAPDPKPSHGSVYLSLCSLCCEENIDDNHFVRTQADNKINGNISVRKFHSYFIL